MMMMMMMMMMTVMIMIMITLLTVSFILTSFSSTYPAIIIANIYLMLFDFLTTSNDEQLYN